MPPKYLADAVSGQGPQSWQIAHIARVNNDNDNNKGFICLVIRQHREIQLKDVNQNQGLDKYHNCFANISARVTLHLSLCSHIAFFHLIKSNCVCHNRIWHIAFVRLYLYLSLFWWIKNTQFKNWTFKGIQNLTKTCWALFSFLMWP